MSGQLFIPLFDQKVNDIVTRHPNDPETEKVYCAKEYYEWNHIFLSNTFPGECAVVVKLARR
jgi:hypothetical protein